MAASASRVTGGFIRPRIFLEAISEEGGQKLKRIEGRREEAREGEEEAGKGVARGRDRATTYEGSHGSPGFPELLFLSLECEKVR